MMKRKYGTIKDRSNSEEYRKNLSDSLKGHAAWNKGLKGVQKSTRKGKSKERNFQKKLC